MNRSKKYMDEEDKDILIFEADSDEKIGEQVGECFEEEIETALSTAESRKDEIGTKAAINIEEYKQMLIKFCPEYLEGLKGMAKATGRSEEELLRASAILPTLTQEGCTTFAANEKATADGKTYTGWNLDLSILKSILKQPWFSVVKPKGFLDRYNYVCYGIPYLIHFGILNEQGLTSVMSAIPPLKDYGPGLPYMVINHIIMRECASVEGACNRMKSLPRMVVGPEKPGFLSLNNLNFLLTDAEGGIGVIESSHNYCEFHSARNDNHGHKLNVQASANHHQYIAELSGCEPGDIESSVQRSNKMWDLLDGKNYGKIDIEKSQEFLRNKEAENPKLHGICNDTTLCSMLIVPKDKMVYFCEGKPCIEGNEYKPHDFEKRL